METTKMEALTTRELDTLGKRLHPDGKFGADYAPMKKHEKINFIWQEAVRLSRDGTDSSTSEKDILEFAKAWVDELAGGILAARDENGPQPEADEASDCDTGASSQEGDILGEAKVKQTQGQPGQGQTPGGEGFGFDGKNNGKSPCESAGGEDLKCRYHEGNLCPTFEHQGNCPSCGIDYANAKHHNNQADGTKCPVEQALDKHHENQHQAFGDPDPVKDDLITLIRKVTHLEHDPTFGEIGDAFQRAEKIVYATANAAARARVEAAAALTTANEAKDAVKDVRRKKLSTATDLVIQWPQLPPVKIAGKHPVIFPQLMALFALPDDIRQPVCLYGPAGGGKSTVVEQVADAFGLFPDNYGAVSCTGAMSEGKIVGRILPIGEGRYIPSDLVRLIDKGEPFVYCWDEFDAAPAEIRVGSNTLLAQGAIYVEERSFANQPVRIPVPSGARFASCQNTDGNGADAMYVGRQAQDAAANDRWIMLHMESDPRVSASILGAEYTPLLTWVPKERTEDELRAELIEAHSWITMVRKEVQKKGMRRLITDRAALRARALLTAGFSTPEMQNIILAGWKTDEKAMVDVSV